MKIAVVGSYGVGLTMRVPKAPGAGETVSGARFDEGPGGKGSNQAIAAARLGADVAFLTAVGDDDFGRSARALWEREGVDASRVSTSAEPTMVGFIIVEPSGENRIVIAPGALDTLDAAAVETFRGEIEAADVLVVSMEIPMDAVLAALRVGRESGTTTLLNPAPAQRLPDEAWALIDIVTPNQTEAPILLGLDDDHGMDDEQLAERLRDTGATVVLTRGGRGALLAGKDGSALRPVEPMVVENVVDTTGAGDTFTAALAVSLAEGKNLAEAAHYAAAAGAHSVTIAGVIPSLPSRDDIAAKIGSSR